MTPPFVTPHRHLIEEAAAKLVAVADDSGESLVTMIAAMERYVVEETKVGGAVPLRSGRRAYTLHDSHLVEAA